jgi:tRNA 2-thiouridine synthesizing protein A
MDDVADPVESLRADAVLAFVERVEGVQCVACRATLCGHQAVMNLVMGFKNAPRCLSCLAKALNRNRENLRDHLFAHINHHECYREGWQWASGREGFDRTTSPSCLWGQEEEIAMSLSDSSVGPSEPEALQGPISDVEWDAGDMGCGDLVLELRMRLQSMNPREVLKVTARDPGAPEDLPAWCRLTGHSLEHWRHPEYWIRRKER